MTGELKPIRTGADYKKAFAEIERLWGAKSGTPEGDRLEVLATLVEAYEAEHYPIDPPDPATFAALECTPPNPQPLDVTKPTLQASVPKKKN